MHKGMKRKFGKDESKMVASSTMDQDRKTGKKKGRRKRSMKK